MTICGGQRDAPRDTIPRTNFRRDAGPSTALAGYATRPDRRAFRQPRRTINQHMQNGSSRISLVGMSVSVEEKNATYTAMADTANSPSSTARKLSRDSGCVECCITDDNLWRPTRRAEGHYTKDKPSTRRGAVHSIGWLCPRPDCRRLRLSSNDRLSSGCSALASRSRLCTSIFHTL